MLSACSIFRQILKADFDDILQVVGDIGALLNIMGLPWGLLYKGDDCAGKAGSIEVQWSRWSVQTNQE